LNDKKNPQQAAPVISNIDGAAPSESILVIDSGVGGLSVCRSILAQLPSLKIIYFADNAYFPYGMLPETELSTRLKFIVGRMLERYQPKLVVLACNTVSTLMLPELRALYEIPFVGVVPAIKPAALMTKTKGIGLLATPATIARAYTDQLIHDYAQDCDVVRVGSSELVLEAERLLNDQSVNKQVIDDVLEPFKQITEANEVDTVVLGCTHFPLLKKYLKESLPEVNWVDSGEAIANRVSHLLRASSKDKDIINKGDKTHQLYFSKPIDHKAEFSNALRTLGFKSFEFHYL
jgi:glutamate racemase